MGAGQVLQFAESRKEIRPQIIGILEITAPQLRLRIRDFGRQALPGHFLPAAICQHTFLPRLSNILCRPGYDIPCVQNHQDKARYFTPDLFLVLVNIFRSVVHLFPQSPLPTMDHQARPPRSTPRNSISQRHLYHLCLPIFR